MWESVVYRLFVKSGLPGLSRGTRAVCVGGGRGGCVVVGDPFVPYVVEVAYRTGQVVVFLGQLKLRAVCQVMGECAHSFGGGGEFLGGCAQVDAGLSAGLDKPLSVPKFASCA